jgi:hypothetical protein
VWFNSNMIMQKRKRKMRGFMEVIDSLDGFLEDCDVDVFFFFDVDYGQIV